MNNFSEKVQKTGSDMLEEENVNSSTNQTNQTVEPLEQANENKQIVSARGIPLYVPVLVLAATVEKVEPFFGSANCRSYSYYSKNSHDEAFESRKRANKGTASSNVKAAETGEPNTVQSCGIINQTRDEAAKESEFGDDFKENKPTASNETAESGLPNAVSSCEIIKQTTGKAAKESEHFDDFKENKPAASKETAEKGLPNAAQSCEIINQTRDEAAKESECSDDVEDKKAAATNEMPENLESAKPETDTKFQKNPNKHS